MTLPTASKLDLCKARLDRAGYCVVSDPVVPLPLLEAARARIPHIIAGEYDTGTPPTARRAQPHDRETLQQIFNPHLCDRSFRQLVTHSGLGNLLAEILESKRIQVLGSQLFIKPGGGAPQAITPWHSEAQHVRCFTEGCYQVWMPFSEVDENSGTLWYLPGSHQCPDGPAVRDVLANATKFEKGKRVWNQTEGLQKAEAIRLRPGGISVHHQYTLHGSPSNESNTTRYALSIGIGTDTLAYNTAEDPFGFIAQLSDQVVCPVVVSNF
ncbi:MAG: phytanoyl-CoA dioxygenase family protein [Bacteroidota bacterium]